MMLLHTITDTTKDLSWLLKLGFDKFLESKVSVEVIFPSMSSPISASLSLLYFNIFMFESPKDAQEEREEFS
jgi:hypothetical protein